MILTGLLVGAVFGFVLQRGRFCLTGGFRDMYIAKDNRIFYALLIAIAIQSVGVYAMLQAGVITYTAGSFFWLADIVGAFVFGIGIVLAGGCATGTWYRAGEGLVGSWVALFGYMLMSAVMRAGAPQALTLSLQSVQFPTNSIPDSLNLPTLPFVAALVIIVLVLVVRELRKTRVVVPELKAKRQGLAHLLFEKRWHPFITAIFIGLIATVAWPLSEATERLDGLGITSPTANILQFLVTGNQSFINWGVFLVLGIFIGAFIAAKASHEFRLRVPDGLTIIRSLIGGLLMGLGATWAGGCTIGNGLTRTAVFTYQGWVALAFMIFGVWTASYFMFVAPARRRKAVLA